MPLLIVTQCARVCNDGAKMAQASMSPEMTREHGRRGYMALLEDYADAAQGLDCSRL